MKVNRVNLKGMSNILNKDTVDPGVDYRKVEDEMVDNITIDSI